MTPASSVDAATLATVTVTFNPDPLLLEIQLRALPRNCIKLVVDNASHAESFSKTEAIAEQLPGVRLVRNATNLGLAAAVNLGVQLLNKLKPVPQFVLLLDQDSEPQPGSIEIMLAAFHNLEAGGQHVGCIGPQLRDPETGLTHGFHQCTRWRWKRVYPSAASSSPVACANVNGSGTLVRVSLFLQLGGLDSGFFIDHVDTEWSFRVLASGYTLWGVPNAIFNHRMGRSSVRFWWFGWRLWPARSPQRHYYLFCNAVALMRKTYVPRTWKLWAVAKLVMTATVVAIAGPQRSKQLSNMTRGIVAGMRRGEKPNG